MHHKYIRKQLHSLNPRQKKELLVWSLILQICCILFLTVTCVYLYRDKKAEDRYWENALLDPEAETSEFQAASKNAVPVTCGTYVENLMRLSFKENYFRVIFNVWFSWEGDPDLNMASHFRIYKGTINRMKILENDSSDEKNYQLVRVDATVSKDFWTVRFPLESHQLRFYIEPDYHADQVILKADTQNSTMLPEMTITGFKLSRHAASIHTVKYDKMQSNPELATPYTQELCTSIEINRLGFGLYLKCFIALAGTLIWIFITLFICTYHSIDPIRLIPAALFGAVTNIMVGANILPDSMQTGLLEFVNIGGVLIIIACTICVVKINRIRSSDQDNDYAYLFGHFMFFILLSATLLGSVLYPLMAYRF